MILSQKAGSNRFSVRGAGCGAKLARTSLTVVVAASLSLPIAPATAQGTQNAGSRLQGQVRYNKISGPEVGVQLLEKIFSKVMNLPQIAMANQAPPVQQLAAPASLEQRERNERDQLMIRPKSDKAKAAYVSQTPSLRVLPNAGSGGLPSNMGKLGEKLHSDNRVYGDEGGESSGLATRQLSPFQTAEPNVDSWKGGQLARAKEAADKSGVRDWDSLDSVGSEGIRQYQTGQSLAEEESAAANARRSRSPQDLGTTFGKLAGVMSNVNKKMEEAQQLAEAAPAPSAPPRTITASETKFQSKPGLYRAPAQMQINDDRPALKDSRGAASTQSQIQLSKAGAFIGKDKMPANAIPVELLKIEDAKKQSAGNVHLAAGGSQARAQGRFDANTNLPYGSGRTNQAAAQLGQLMRSGKRELIALLPPTVATGIPLVTLGTSQRDALAAMQRMGQIKEQKVGQWTVITCKKDSANGPTSLQLFFRHGLLDAMRIFNPSLIAPDFGVSPGDSLERMKGKFGEPAFMIEEPSMQESQNYIYPISQVGFQLARRNPDADPQVVSVLIFSVK